MRTSGPHNEPEVGKLHRRVPCTSQETCSLQRTRANLAELMFSASSHNDVADPGHEADDIDADLQTLGQSDFVNNVARGPWRLRIGLPMIHHEGRARV